MKKLRLWNGRPYGVLDQVDWGSSHIYVAAYSKADARRVCLEAGHSDPGYNEVTKYWSECWGNSMNGIVPERGLWMTTGHNQKPVRLTKEANMEPGEIMEAQDEFDAGLDKAEERRIWIENRAKQLFEDGVDFMGMANEVDAIELAGNLLEFFYKKRLALRIYADTEVLKYCFQIAEQEANDAGY